MKNAIVYQFFALLTFIMPSTTAPAQEPKESGLIVHGLSIDELYAVQYHYYKTHPVGTVKLENSTTCAIAAKIAFEMGRYTTPLPPFNKGDTKAEPEKLTVHLAPHETRVVNLTADFTDDVLDIVKTTQYDAEVKIDVDDRMVKQILATVKMHGRRMIPEGKLEKLAFFINPDDEVIGIVTSQWRFTHEDNNVEKAKQAFSMLKELKVDCVNAATPPEVLHPRELLRYKLGNPYDCVVLYAAILEHLGVRTMLGLTESDAVVLFELEGNPSDLQTVEQSGKKWLPVTPNFELPFFDAYQAGFSNYHRWHQQKQLTLVNVHQDWKTYPPVAFKPLAQDFLEVGIMYGQQKKYGEAREQFELALKLDTGNAAALNNLGNIATLEKRYDEAVSYYQQALQSDPADYAICLNFGMVYYTQGKEADAMEWFLGACRKMHSYREMLMALGISANSERYFELREFLLKIAQQAQKEKPTDEVFPGAPGESEDGSVPLYWKVKKSG
ncbi:tetratricopeptide repeat protein [Candidatus Poribacteria bacterium]|nr:tetratricopeptide repeat protein [Candidatus Poribacteria bacterium]